MQRIRRTPPPSVDEVGVAATRNTPSQPAHADGTRTALHPRDLQTLAGNRAVSGMLTAQRTVGPVTVQRLQASPSPFAGWAGTADVRAGEAAMTAAGPAPVHVGSEYAQQQAARKEQQMATLLAVDLGDYYQGSQDSWQYKKLVTLRQGYLDDIPRIDLAQGAYNDFVAPATFAAKSMAQYRALQRQLGYEDGDNPADDLSARQRRALSKNLDEEKLGELNNAVDNSQMIAEGKRTEILGISHNIQSGMQRKAAMLAQQEKAAGEAEKAEIQEKIKAVTEGVETFTKVIEAVAFVAAGAPEAVEDIGAAVSEEEGEHVLRKGVKGGLELAGKASSIVGIGVEWIMTQRYKDELQKAQQHIMEAQAAISSAQALGVEFENVGWTFQAAGALQELTGYLGQWAQALINRKKYFAQLGAASDRASGTRAGGETSQYLALVSQAADTQSYIKAAQSSADQAMTVVQAQIAAMRKHRNESYVFDAASVFGTAPEYVDGDGPDLNQIRGTLDVINQYATTHTSNTYIDGEYQQTGPEAAASSAAAVSTSLPAAR